MRTRIVPVMFLCLGPATELCLRQEPLKISGF
jgi:hypothetical protein